jgi:hydrogenase maturation protease
VSRREAARRVLVAGIGNVFLGDDGFGVEVVGRLDPGSLPASVDAVDYGIRGVHLAYELLDGRYDTLILVDAVPTGEPPGTVCVFEVAPGGARGGGAEDAGEPVPIDGHGMTPTAVLDLLANLGGAVDRVLVVGCEPAVVEERMALSEVVLASVDQAVDLVAELACREAMGTAGVSSGTTGPG